MKKKRTDLECLGDILNTIKIAKSFISYMDFEDFRRDLKTQYAVIRSLEIIGEAVTKLSDGIKNRYDDVPWRKIIDMRNKLIHDYYEVQVEIAWDTITRNIPLVEKRLSEIKANLSHKKTQRGIRR